MLADVYTPVVFTCGCGTGSGIRSCWKVPIFMQAKTAIHLSVSMPLQESRSVMHPTIEFKLPAKMPERIKISDPADVPELLWDFMQRFEVREAAPKPVNVAQGLFGYTTFDAVQFFDTIKLDKAIRQQREGPEHSADALPALPICYCHQSF